MIIIIFPPYKYTHWHQKMIDENGFTQCLFIKSFFLSILKISDRNRENDSDKCEIVGGLQIF